jgi:hypothetical protein
VGPTVITVRTPASADADKWRGFVVMKIAEESSFGSALCCTSCVLGLK